MIRLSMISLICTALVALGGCSRDDPNQVAFDGVLFKSKTGAIDKKVSRADFTVTVFEVSQSLDGARAAAGYEGTKYCVTNYGTSDIEWTVGPETEPGRLAVVDNAITFQGRCDP